MRDNPSHWTDDYCPAPHFDRIGFQKKLDTVSGTAKGHSIVRVVWGGEEELEVETAITSLGSKKGVTKIGRHRTRVRGVAGKVRKRRWIVEEWQAPAQIPQDAFVKVGGASGLFVPPSVIDEQKYGKWLEVYIIADHSKCKPEDCNSLEYFCFGDYRAPDASDLALLQRAKAQRDAGPVLDPFAPVSQDAVEQWNKEADEETDAKESMEAAAMEEVWADRRKTLTQHTVNG